MAGTVSLSPRASWTQHEPSLQHPCSVFICIGVVFLSPHAVLDPEWTKFAAPLLRVYPRLSPSAFLNCSTFTTPRSQYSCLYTSVCFRREPVHLQFSQMLFPWHLVFMPPYLLLFSFYFSSPFLVRSSLQCQTIHLNLHFSTMKAYQAPREKRCWFGPADHTPLLARMLLDLYSESHHLLVVQLSDYPHYAGVVWPSYSDLALCLWGISAPVSLFLPSTLEMGKGWGRGIFSLISL